MGTGPSIVERTRYTSRGASPVIRWITPDSSVADDMERSVRGKVVSFDIEHAQAKHDAQMKAHGISVDSRFRPDTHLYEQAWWHGFRKCTAQRPSPLVVHDMGDGRLHVRCASSPHSWQYSASIPMSANFVREDPIDNPTVREPYNGGR